MRLGWKWFDDFIERVFNLGSYQIFKNKFSWLRIYKLYILFNFSIVFKLTFMNLKFNFFHLV